MFKSKAVIVVGAGASAEVGLPVGAKLKSDIADRLNIKFPDGYRQVGGDKNIYQAYELLSRTSSGAGDANRYRAVGVKISDSLPLAISIDNYLEAHAGNEDVELCSKLAIVQSILHAERRSSLYFDHRMGRSLDTSKGELQSTWYMAFLKSLTESVAAGQFQSIFSNVSFVIFNYDRCVEVFLHAALRRYFDKSESEVEAVLNGVNFFHPYGVVGRLPWQTDGSSEVNFGADVGPASLVELAGGIRTFSERIESGDFLGRMRSELAAADTVVYLGFSFHPQNMELLTVESPGRVRRVYATAYEISGSDRAVIEKGIRRSLRPTASDFPVELPDKTCAGLFAEFSRSITQ